MSQETMQVVPQEQTLSAQIHLGAGTSTISVPLALLLNPDVTKGHILFYALMRRLAETGSYDMNDPLAVELYESFISHIGDKAWSKHFKHELRDLGWIAYTTGEPDKLAIFAFDDPAEGKDFAMRMALLQRYLDDEVLSNPGQVYLIQSISRHYKIGRSKNVQSRYKTFGTTLPFEVELQHVIDCRDYTEAEFLLHDWFQDRRVGGEWFALNQNDVRFIKTIERM